MVFLSRINLSSTADFYEIDCHPDHIYSFESVDLLPLLICLDLKYLTCPDYKCSIYCDGNDNIRLACHMFRFLQKKVHGKNTK